MPKTSEGIDFGLYKKVNGAQVLLGLGQVVPDTRPCNAVTNVHSDSTTTTSLVASWNAPVVDATHPAAVTYEIAVGAGGAFVANGAARTKSLTGLTPGTAYAVKIRPTTAGGVAGPVTTATLTTTSGPPPPPPPSTPASFGIASDDLHGRISVVESTGGRVECARIYAQPADNWGQNNPTQPGSLHTQILTELAAGRDIVLSIKTAGGDWSNVAAGAEDAAINGLAAFLHTTMLANPSRKMWICIHHEPSTANNPGTGEGGTPAEFAAMQDHALPILKAAAPSQIRVGILGNGYWFRSKGAKATDAQLNAWTPPSSRAYMDFIGGDDYQPGDLATPSGWGEDPTLRTKNRIAWFGRVGYTGAVVIGEVNAFVGQYLVNMLQLAKHDPAFRNGAVCIWDNKTSRAGYLSDTSPTGQAAPKRLSGVQAQLKNWHDGI